MLRGFCVHWGTSTFSEVFLRPFCCLWQKPLSQLWWQSRIQLNMFENIEQAVGQRDWDWLAILGQTGWVDWSRGLLHWEWTSREVETGAVWGGQDSRSDRWVLYREERQLCLSALVMLLFGCWFYKKGQVWGCSAPALVSTALYYLVIFD